MKNEDVIYRINTVVSDILGVDRTELSETTTLIYLGVDDIDVVEIIMELEKKFDIVIPDEEIFENEEENYGLIKDMKQLYDIVLSKTN